VLIYNLRLYKGLKCLC